jgi:pimeloyl-ACP methyl ester carboxylesterase
VDLPADDPSAGVAEYAATVVDTLRDLPGPVVLVGHSLGGLTIPVVAGQREAALLVYLCALLPQPGMSLLEQRVPEPDMMTDAWRRTYLPQQEKLPDGRTAWPPSVAREVFYHDCPPAAVPQALSTMRPQGSRPMSEQTPLTAWPAVPAAYVLAEGDRVVDPAWSRRVARSRLGVEPLSLTGGHSPFLARPRELCDVLLEAVARAGC